MSPEQALGRRRALDHRTDVYSLGATLYELLSLEPAFGGDDRQELLRRIASEEPRPARRLNAAVPADLETVVAKAMAKAPDERYATARDLADDLRRFLEDRPIRARRPSLWQKGRKWARRNAPVVWSLALFVTLALVGTLLGAVVYASKEKSARKSSDAKLYRALLDEAFALRVARKPGYRAKVWQNLHEAVQLNVPEKNLDRVRDEVLACLGDPVGLEALDRVHASSVARAERPRVSARWEEVVREELKRGGVSAPARYPQAVSPDGKILAFSVAGGRVQFRPRDGDWRQYVDSTLGAVYDLAFTPDRRSLIAGCEEGVIVWDVSALPRGAVRWSSRCGNIFAVAAQPGGRLLATAGRRLELWSLDTNRLVASLEPPANGATVEFSADGKWLLAVAGDEAVAGWPLDDTSERWLLHSHQGGVPAVAFSPDGRRLSAGSKGGAALIWDAASGRLLHTCRACPAALGHFGTVESVAFSPHGRLLAAGDFRGALYFWDTETGKEVAQAPPSATKPPGQVWRVQFSPSGRYVAAGGAKGVAIWEVRADGAAVTLQRARSATGANGEALAVYDLAFHPDEAELVFLSAGGWLHRMGLAKGDEARPFGPRAGVQLRALQFDPTGERLTYVTPTSTLGVYDWRTGAARDTGQKAFQVALSGRWVATPNPAHEVVLYDLEADRPAYALPAESSDVWGLAFSPDGARLAVGLSDGGVAVWDLEQVRTRLADFDVYVPSTARAGRP
jgi:WD40 repeat protein